MLPNVDAKVGKNCTPRSKGWLWLRARTSCFLLRKRCTTSRPNNPPMQWYHSSCYVNDKEFLFITIPRWPHSLQLATTILAANNILRVIIALGEQPTNVVDIFDTSRFSPKNTRFDTQGTFLENGSATLWVGAPQPIQYSSLLIILLV